VAAGAAGTVGAAVAAGAQAAKIGRTITKNPVTAAIRKNFLDMSLLPPINKLFHKH
jgi:hypothetical protein